MRAASRWIISRRSANTCFRRTNRTSGSSGCCCSACSPPRATRPAAVWPAVNYFSLWAVRLSGFLPELRVSANPGGLAEEMMQMPIGATERTRLDRRYGGRSARLLVRSVQDHIERKIQTAALLESSLNMDSFQDTLFKLKKYWSDRGCIIRNPTTAKSAREPCARRPSCACSDRSPTASPMSSPAAGPPTADTARTRTGCTSTSSFR